MQHHRQISVTQHTGMTHGYALCPRISDWMPLNCYPTPMQLPHCCKSLGDLGPRMPSVFHVKSFQSKSSVAYPRGLSHVALNAPWCRLIPKHKQSMHFYNTTLP